MVKYHAREITARSLVDMFQFDSIVTLQCPDCQYSRTHSNVQTTLKLAFPSPRDVGDTVCSF